MSKQSSHLVDANQLNSAVDCSNSRNVSAFKPATRISYYNLCELTRFKFGLFSSEAFLYIFFNFSKGFVSFGVMAAFKVCKLAFREHPIGIRGSRSRSARVCGRSSVGWPIVAEVLRNEFLSEALKARRAQLCDFVFDPGFSAGQDAVDPFDDNARLRVCLLICSCSRCADFLDKAFGLQLLKHAFDGALAHRRMGIHDFSFGGWTNDAFEVGSQHFLVAAVRG